MKNLFSLGVVLAGLLFCLGCDGSKPVSTEAETKKLYESPEYEKQMMGQMSGGGDAASK